MLDLRGVAGELLAQTDRHGVLKVSPADLDDVIERLGLGEASSFWRLSRAGISFLRTPSSAATWMAVGDDVVGRLPHVDRVVGMDRRLTPSLSA